MEARSHTGKTAAHIMPCSGDADENMAEEKKKDKSRDENERKPKVLTLHCSSLQPYDSTSTFVAAAALLSSAVYLSQVLKHTKTEATTMPQSCSGGVLERRAQFVIRQPKLSSCS